MHISQALRGEDKRKQDDQESEVNLGFRKTLTPKSNNRRKRKKKNKNKRKTQRRRGRRKGKR